MTAPAAAGRTVTSDEPTRQDVLAAAERIRGRVRRTPVLAGTVLDELLGVKCCLKCEHQQFAGAFKARGAANAVLCLPDDVQVVATHSSGNHGAALALAAQRSGLDAVVVVPSDARTSKRQAIERYGGRIVECEPTLEARESTLAAVVAETGAVFVPPYDHPHIIAGAGTAALELQDECPGLTQIWVPVGGGGLAAGTVLAAAGRTQVVLAEPQLARDAKDSLASGRLHKALPPLSVADGLRTGLGKLNFRILRKAKTPVFLASEHGIERWTRLLAERAGIVVEPSAAVTLAAMAENPGSARGRVGVVLSGGNV